MFDVLVDEVAGLSDAELVERFRELERSARRHEAELAAVVAELEGRTRSVSGVCRRPDL